MTKYLLAAEADRIQDLLFRSSQLREVVGGSQLLKRFGDDVPQLLADALGLTLGSDVDIITKGGGSFYLEFAQEDAARQFGAALGEAYYRSTGGTLSVIEPVEYSGSDEDYPDASEKAGKRLRAAKRRGSFVAVTQIPYVAFCESCGVGLAEAHEKRFEDEVGQGQYLCTSCRAKAAERVDQSLGQFLKPFYARIVKPELLMGKHKMDWPQDADSVGRLDPRNYVAYLVADGDGMGDVFHSCSKAQAELLSDRMDEVLQISLARPLKTFLKAPTGNTFQQFMPVLPLILGGDDLFALIPAQWALDIAGRLCLNFQQEMTKFARDQGILEGNKAITMTAVVVICKANYPYYLAHEIGEERLGQAKRVVKALAKDENRYLSAVDFEVILGSQVEPVTHDKDADYLATLRPYWVLPDDAAPPPPEWGLPLDSLLEQRLALAAVNLPARRRSQLRELMNKVPRKGDSQPWDEALVRLLARVERDRRWRERHPLRQALEELGGVELDNWQEVTRTSDKDHWQGNGMGDLLRVWDWALRIDEDPLKYEGGQA
jgi:hypothetical protein